MQHYAGAIQEFFGQPLGIVAHWMFSFLTPSGDHLFLALAAFNIGRRPREQFISVYPQKLRTYLLLFGFFWFENFLITNDLGSALRWGPLLTWMLVLALLSLVYRYFSWQGVLVLFLVQLLRWWLPMDQFNDSLEIGIQQALSVPNFWYESRIDYFIGSGCLGFLFGYCFWSSQVQRRFSLFGIVFLVGIALNVLFYLFGEFPEVDVLNVWGTEYDLIKSLPGACHIWGTQLLIIAGALSFEFKFIPLSLPVVNWCGRHSLLVFGLHRIFFIQFLLPIIAHNSQLSGRLPSTNVLLMFCYSLLAVGFAYLVRRSGVLMLLSTHGNSTK